MYDICTLANQFSLWDLMEEPLEKLETVSRQLDFKLGLAQACYFRAAVLMKEGRYQDTIGQYDRALEYLSGEKKMIWRPRSIMIWDIVTVE